LFQERRGAAGDAFGDAGQAGDVDAVRAVGAALDDGMQKDDVFAAFQHVDAIRAQPLE
jgi:hypothetical protein